MRNRWWTVKGTYSRLGSANLTVKVQAHTMEEAVKLANQQGLGGPYVSIPKPLENGHAKKTASRQSSRNC